MRLAQNSRTMTAAVTRHPTSTPLHRQFRLMARRFVLVCAINGAMALALSFLMGSRLSVQLVYAYAIGLLIWLSIDGGRFLVSRGQPSYWPDGWRRITLIAVGVAFGYVSGTLVGDWYAGQSTLELLHFAPQRFWGILLFGATVCVAFVWHFIREATLEREQALAAEAHLKLIESQLEPHMLFNTLANLRALIQTDAGRAIEMLDRFNDYLRATLAASRTSTHALDVEFARCRDYLELMAMRMGARLTFSLDLPPALGGLPVPPFILQPLVENALRHGLEPHPAGGRVVVCARAEAQQLVLDVRDNGAGLSHLAPSGGFGLTQVRERLEVRYGKAATLRVTAQADGGVSAQIRIQLDLLKAA